MISNDISSDERGDNSIISLGCHEIYISSSPTSDDLYNVLNGVIALYGSPRLNYHNNYDDNDKKRRWEIVDETIASADRHEKTFLYLILTDGEQSFTAELTAEQDLNEKLLCCIVKSILGLSPNLSVRYFYASDSMPGNKSAQQCIRIKIEDKPGSFVRNVWCGTCFPHTKEMVTDSFVCKLIPETYSNSSHAFKFISKTMEIMKSMSAKIQKLEDEQAQLKKNVWAWKDTAQKLDETWQNEKNSLFERFLLLYKKSKEELIFTRNQLEEERKLREFSLFNHPEKKQALVMDRDDESAFELFDPVVVERLARSPVSNENKSLKQRDQVFKSVLYGTKIEDVVIDENVLSGPIEKWAANGAIISSHREDATSLIGQKLLSPEYEKNEVSADIESEDDSAHSEALF